MFIPNCAICISGLNNESTDGYSGVNITSSKVISRYCKLDGKVYFENRCLKCDEGFASKRSAIRCPKKATRLDNLCELLRIRRKITTLIRLKGITKYSLENHLHVAIKTSVFVPEATIILEWHFSILSL